MSIMQLVKKKKGKKRPGYRGPGEYQGGASSGSGKSSSNTGGGFTGGGGGGADASTQSFDKSANPNRPGGPIGRDDSGAPGPDRSAVSQFSQFGRNVLAQNLNPNLRFDPKTGGMKRSFLGGLGSTVFGGLLSLINPALGLAVRGFDFLKDKVPQTLQDFRSSNTLEEFRDKLRGYGRTMPVTFNNPNFDLMIGGENEEDNIITPMAKPTINLTDPNELSNELINFEQGQTISPLQAKDGGRIQYMDGGIADLLDIYD